MPGDDDDEDDYEIPTSKDLELTRNFSTLLYFLPSRVFINIVYTYLHHPILYTKHLLFLVNFEGMGFMSSSLGKYCPIFFTFNGHQKVLTFSIELLPTFM